MGVVLGTTWAQGAQKIRNQSETPQTARIRNPLGHLVMRTPTNESESPKVYCKSFIPGSNPGGASILPPPKTRTPAEDLESAMNTPARMRTAGSSRGDRFRYRASARPVPEAPTRPRIALTGRPEAHPGGASSLPFLRTRAIGSSGPSPAQPRPDENRRFEPRRPIPVSRVSALRAAGADAAEDRPYWATGGPSGRRLYPDSPKHNKSSGRPESAATPLSHGWSDSCTRCTW